MSKRLFMAAALLGATGLLHLIMGGTDVYAPLWSAAPTPELRLYTALLWHFVTAFFTLAALGMGWAALAPVPRRQTALGITALTLAMGGLFLTYGFVLLGEPWTAPQWTICAAIAVLTLWHYGRSA